MQLGILTFLRRSPKTLPPLTVAAPTAAVSAETPPVRRATATPAQPAAEEERPLPAPQTFQSARYGYHLTLPPGWRVDEPRSIAGSPPIDRFRSPDGLRVGVWNERCPLRVLPNVPPTERAGKLRLADGLVVPFAAFAPSVEEGSQFLEGRWLAGGKRWTMHVQVPTDRQRAPLLEALGGVLASLTIDG